MPVVESIVLTLFYFLPGLRWVARKKDSWHRIGDMSSCYQEQALSWGLWYTSIHRNHKWLFLCACALIPRLIYWLDKKAGHRTAGWEHGWKSPDSVGLWERSHWTDFRTTVHFSAFAEHFLHNIQSLDTSSPWLHAHLLIKTVWFTEPTWQHTTQESYF